MSEHEDHSYSFVSPSGILVRRREMRIDYDRGIDFLIESLDSKRGGYFSSGVEDQDRYSRWEFGFVDPPIEIVARKTSFHVRALNPRGVIILALLKPVLTHDDRVSINQDTERELILTISRDDGSFAEEARSQQPSNFTPLRSILADFKGLDDGGLGLYGAFGYDLIFEFDPIPLHLKRSNDDKLFHLFLPDRILRLDRRLEQAHSLEYNFSRRELTTDGAGDQPFQPIKPSPNAINIGNKVTSDHTPNEYESKVSFARKRMRLGDIFEIVLSRQYQIQYDGPASLLFRLMRRINPSPYEFFLQFDNEQLVGASPEMFVRVEDDKVESSPISGTARRGTNAMEDAERIKALYDSEKDEVELTMCTDVDRNDKARICKPGSVKLLSRRKIERYAGLFHTVDHVEGRLRDGFDGIDAFLSHMWAVTLTGAPKRKAVEIIETQEVSARRWYGGAIGAIMLNGTVNTGITIRTVHISDRLAAYRTGATLVWDSHPEAEEKETEIKATAFFNAVEQILAPNQKRKEISVSSPLYTGTQIVMIDNEDSFVHTLADYFRQTGAEVHTYRRNISLESALKNHPDLVVHSPGPGHPKDFQIPEYVRKITALNIPQFGVCLGLQGIVEAFGGRLDILAEPHHGKYWNLSHNGTGIFEGVSTPCRVGGYHSLYAVADEIPKCLEVIATNESNLVMAVKHRKQAIAAVQFHPESILSLDNNLGQKIVENTLKTLLNKK